MDLCNSVETTKLPIAFFPSLPFSYSLVNGVDFVDYVLGKAITNRIQTKSMTINLLGVLKINE